MRARWTASSPADVLVAPGDRVNDCAARGTASATCERHRVVPGQALALAQRAAALICVDVVSDVPRLLDPVETTR